MYYTYKQIYVQLTMIYCTLPVRDVKRIEQMISNTFFHPTTDNVDKQVIFSPFGWKKNPLRFSNIDYRERGIYTQFSLSVPTTFVWDCLKEKCEEFSSAGNTRDCHDVTVFLTIEVDLGSVTYTFFLETAQNVSTLI